MRSIIEMECRFTARNYEPLPVVIVRGEGVYLWDEDDNKYIDMMSAYSAVSHGHGHPRLLKVLREQAGDLCIISRAFYNNRLAPFLEKLCRMTDLDMALPMNTGAEAVETAIKAARLWGYKVKGIENDKAKIIVADGNFHGRTTAIVGFSSDDEYREGFGPFAPGFIRVPFGDVSALEEAITDDVCAFLVEPLQGEAGIIIPPEGWLLEVQKICKERNVLLILDEVQTGLGRTGKLFAYQHEIDKPDGLILGKALGGGIMPVSVFLANNEVMQLFTPGSHGSTFGGNPLGSAIGMEALCVLEDEKLVENSAELGAYMLDSLLSLNHKAIKEVRGRGLWIGLEVDSKMCTARKVCEDLMRRGVLSKETHETVVRFAPPLIVTKEVVDEVVSCVDNVFSNLQIN